MVTVTFDELEQYRAHLADAPDALRILDVIEDCDGNVEDAAIVLALRVGQEPDESDRWLEGQAKRWRSFLCQSNVRSILTPKTLPDAVRSLTTDATVPLELAVPVLIYVLKTGVDPFCKPMEEKL